MQTFRAPTALKFDIKALFRVALTSTVLLTTGILLLNTAHADSTGVTPGDGPQCALIAPLTVSFNTVLTDRLDIALTSRCTRYPVKWEWTAPPLDYTTRMLSPNNQIFQPLFDSGVMSWTYDNRKVTNTNTITLTFRQTGTYTFATRAKDADYIPPNNQPAGFWGPWGSAGSTTVPWTPITLTCSPQNETREIGPGGALTCPGGQISTRTETRTFCANSVTPVWGPWTPTTTCACPSGTVWNGASCIPLPVCTVTANPASLAPGGTVAWAASCNVPTTAIDWRLTSVPPPVAGACRNGASCSEAYPEPGRVCYAVKGTNFAGTGPESPPACARVACALPQVWSASTRACGVPPTIQPVAFPVGQPSPTSLPVIVTGTPVLTCSATSLPPGWTMSPTCILTNNVPVSTQPPTPLGCSVTVRNAWGTDSKPCTDFIGGAPRCEVNWERSPIVLSGENYIYPQAKPYSAIDYILTDYNKRTLVSKSGVGRLNVSIANADSDYVVNCDGAPEIEKGVLDAGRGNALVRLTYFKKYANAAQAYQAGFADYYGNGNYDNNNAWVEVSPGIYRWVFPPFDYTAPASLASDPPANPVCRVTVTRASTGQSATCTSPPGGVVVAGERAYCTLPVSMFVNEYKDEFGVTHTNPDINGVVQPFTYNPLVQNNNSRFDGIPPPTPTNAFLQADLMAVGIELSNGPYMPPASSPTWNVGPFFNNDLTCRKRVRTASDLSPVWQPSFQIPLNGQYTVSPSITGSTSAQSRAGSVRRSPGFVDSNYGSYGSVYGPPVSWSDRIDTLNSEYEIECSYNGQGYNGNTGSIEAVSCSGWFKYSPGAVCQPQNMNYTQSGTRYSSGALSGYAAAWTGNLRYLGESVALRGNGATSQPYPTQNGVATAPGTAVATSANSFVPATTGSLEQRCTGETATSSYVAYNPPYETSFTCGGTSYPITRFGITQTTSTGCTAKSIFDVTRVLFPGTSAARVSTTACSVYSGGMMNSGSQYDSSSNVWCADGGGTPIGGGGGGSGGGTGGGGSTGGTGR